MGKYSRRLNWTNGESILLKPGNEEALHRAMHHPPVELAQQISDS